MKDSQQDDDGKPVTDKYIKANNERFSTVDDGACVEP